MTMGRPLTQQSTYPGGSLKAEGLGDGATHRQSGHPQAALEAATRSKTVVVQSFDAFERRKNVEH
jgi:hypothetical protein